MSNTYNCSQWLNDPDNCGKNKQCLYVGGFCVCAAGYGSAQQNDEDCTPCANNQYKPTNGSERCTNCPTNSQGAPLPNTTEGNVYCMCTNNDQGIFNNSCIACNGDGQLINDVNHSCICQPGFAQYDNGSCFITCNATGQMKSPTNQLKCTCMLGYGTNETEDSPTIQCVSCRGNEYKSTSTLGSCLKCPAGFIGLPESNDYGQTAGGPNTKCVSHGSCKNPACLSNGCSTTICKMLYGIGCSYDNVSTCECEARDGYIFDADGNCQQLLSKGIDVGLIFLIIGCIVGCVLLVMVLVGITVYIKRHKTYQKRSKIPLWKLPMRPRGPFDPEE